MQLADDDDDDDDDDDIDLYNEHLRKQTYSRRGERFLLATTYTAIQTARTTTRRPTTSPMTRPRFDLLSTCPVCFPTMFTVGLDV